MTKKSLKTETAVRKARYKNQANEKQNEQKSWKRGPDKVRNRREFTR